MKRLLSLRSRQETNSKETSCFSHFLFTLQPLEFTCIGRHKRTCGDVMEAICHACATNTPSGQQRGEEGGGGTSERMRSLCCPSSAIVPLHRRLQKRSIFSTAPKITVEHGNRKPKPTPVLGRDALRFVAAERIRHCLCAVCKSVQGASSLTPLQRLCRDLFCIKKDY